MKGDKKMECPRCQKGRIRVIKNVACSCNHHPLVCDECYSFFGVDCGPPYEEGVLPPEFPMKFDRRMTRNFKIMTKMKGIDPSKRVNEYPLLEDFKTSLTQKELVTG